MCCPTLSLVLRIWYQPVLMQNESPNSCSAADFGSAICHVPVPSVIVLGAVGTLSSPAEGQSVLKLIRPEVLHNYPFVVLKLLASWHYSHAFWLHSLITWKNGRGNKRSGEPPSSYDMRRKVFVSPECLQVKMEKYCLTNSTEAPALISSPASLKCHNGTDQSVYAFMQYPQLSPVHKWL